VVQVDDVSRRRQAEESARTNLWRLRSIVETATDAFVAMDDSGLIIDWNHQAEQTFGWARDQVIGRALVATLIPPGDRAGLERDLKEYLDTGESSSHYVRRQLRAVDREGRVFPVELTAWPLRAGAASSLVAFFRD